MKDFSLALLLGAVCVLAGAAVVVFGRKEPPLVINIGAAPWLADEDDDDDSEPEPDPDKPPANEHDFTGPTGAYNLQALADLPKPSGR